MNGYFRPLRRKVGVLVVAITCLFAVSWLLGRDRIDLIILNFPGHRWNIATGCGSFQIVSGWLSSHSIEFTPDSPPKTISQTLTISQQPLNDSSFKVSWMKWTAPKMLIRTTLDNSQGDVASTVPYWSVVIPLTYLSAWLLLSKPRSKPPATQSTVDATPHQDSQVAI